MLFCCVPLLQEWLTSHLPRKDSFASNPAGLKWHQRMMALTEKDIFWYSRELDGTEIILSCGDFPNVPLVGTRGCINYNPVLAFRQLGYPMEDKPDNSLLKEFILKEGEENPALLRKIRRAWGQIHKKPWTKKNCIAKPLYTQWVRDRVEANRLPFDMVVRPLSPEPITMVPIEEAEELKAKISELQKKNEDWESKYLQVEGKRARLERDLKYQEGVLQESQKSLKESEDKREKIGDGMLSARENLIAKDEEIERLKQSYGKVKEFGQSATASQKKWRLRYLEQVEETKKIKKQWRHEGNQSQEFEGLYTQEKARREYLQANMERLLAQKNQEFEEQLHLEVGRKQEFENLYFQERERCEHIQAEIEHILRVYEERVARLNEELEEVNTKMAQRGMVLELVWGDSDSPLIHVTPHDNEPIYHTENVRGYSQMDEILEKFDDMQREIKALRGKDLFGKNAHDLCLVPNVQIPAKFKVPDFEKYKGNTCPQSHLVMYARKMSTQTDNDQLLIHYFQDSLTGAALKWYMSLDGVKIRTFNDLGEAFVRQYKYNLDMAPNRDQLQAMSQKDKETFKEYAQRWREVAAQVNSLKDEDEMARIFLN
ncbi:hypothetical protein TSUD_418380, partial [Trifolium subterraneum]